MSYLKSLLITCSTLFAGCSIQTIYVDSPPQKMNAKTLVSFCETQKNTALIDAQKVKKGTVLLFKSLVCNDSPDFDAMVQSSVKNEKPSDYKITKNPNAQLLNIFIQFCNEENVQNNYPPATKAQGAGWCHVEFDPNQLKSSPTPFN